MTHVGRASISGLSCPRHTGGAKRFVISMVANSTSVLKANSRLLNISK